MSRFRSLLIVFLLGACVPYRPAAVEVAPTARGLPPAPGDPLAFEPAVVRVVADNAELRRLRAEASAVNLAPGPEPLRLWTEIEDGDMTRTAIGTDVLSLLGIGRRPAETALRRAEQDERILRHHERARALVGRLAEAFAVDGVLGTLPSPRPELDIDAFAKAGLATKASLAAARAALAEAAAEEAQVGTLRRDERREIARLIGCSPTREVLPVVPAGVWPPVPAAEETGLLYARGDLLRERTAFVVADRRLRLAVARQWPTLGVFLGGNVALESPFQMVEIGLPLDAPAEARAMACAREAARLAFEETVLDALHDAAQARLELEGASARLAGAASRRLAASALGRAAQARVATEAEGAFTDVVMAAMEEVRAAIEQREAAVGLARARVRAAVAAGWPGPGTVEATR